MAPSQLKNEQKVPKMVYIVPYFLVRYFGENFMKILTKLPKLEMNENVHKNVNENMFSFTFLCTILQKLLWWAIKATNMLQLYTTCTNFLYGFNPFKIGSPAPLDCIKFSQF